MKRFLASVHSLTIRKMDIDNHLFHLLRLGLAIDQTAEKYIFTLSVKGTISNEIANVLDKDCENFLPEHDYVFKEGEEDKDDASAHPDVEGGHVTHLS